MLAGAWATGNQARADGTTYAEWIGLSDRGGALAVGGAVWAIAWIGKSNVVLVPVVREVIA